MALHFNLLGRACHAVLALCLLNYCKWLCARSRPRMATPSVDKLVRFLIVFSWRASATQVAAVCLTPYTSVRLRPACFLARLHLFVPVGINAVICNDSLSLSFSLSRSAQLELIVAYLKAPRTDSLSWANIWQYYDNILIPLRTLIVCVQWITWRIPNEIMPGSVVRLSLLIRWLLST